MKKLETALAGLLQLEELVLNGSEKQDEELASAVNAKTKLLKEFRKSFNLEDDAEDSILLPSLKTLMEKSEKTGTLEAEIRSVREKLAVMEQKESDRRMNDLLDQGIRDGKITPATREWWAKLTYDQLEKHLPLAPVIIPQGAASRKDLKEEEILLTSEDKEICRRFGIAEEKFLNQKKEISSNK